MKITFLGAVEEVTGSKYLIEDEDVKILVDCGLFQGNKEITQHNWEPLPIDPQLIDAIILTHAHIDHTGYIPVLVKNGFKGKIYCSKATYALCEILLMDSGSLQEAHSTNRTPLYTVRDVEYSLQFFQTVTYDTVFMLGKFLHITLVSSHHILGASFVIISDGKQKLTFSGDLGRPHSLIMRPTPHLKQTDFLVLESTYGNRLHNESDPLKDLSIIVNETINKGGILIIPAFAVGRTQTILYCLYQLKKKNIIPDIPIFLDSPMAIRVTDLLCQFNDEHTLGSLCKAVSETAIATMSVEASKRLDYSDGPSIIIAGSGMANGGRVLYHLKYFISDPKSTIAFVGFQAKGSTGDLLVNGAKEIKIFDQWHTVNATIKTLDAFSAHADYKEIIEWLGYFEQAPKKIFLTHGQRDATQSLKKKIEGRFDCSVVIPQYLESFDLY